MSRSKCLIAFVGVFELLTVDEEVGGLVQRKAHAAEIRTAALRRGMKRLRLDGIEKVRRGLTTVDEIVRVTSQGAD